MEKPKAKKKPPTKRPPAIPKRTSTVTSGKSETANKVSPVSVKKAKLPTKSTDVKELVVRKRMASLNASAMLAAAYEVERHLDRVESMASSENETPKPTLPKKIKDEVLESKDVIQTTPRLLFSHFFELSFSVFPYFSNFFSIFPPSQSPSPPMWLSFRTPMSPSPASMSTRHSARARKPTVRCNIAFNRASPKSVWYGRRRKSHRNRIRH